MLIIFLGFAGLVALALVMAPNTFDQARGYAWRHPVEVVLAFVSYTGAFVLRALAWRPLIGVKVAVPRLFALIMAALFLNHVAPAKAGDLARMYGLAHHKVPWAHSVASVLLSRLTDLIGLLAVLYVSWALINIGVWNFIAWPAVVMAGIAGLLWLAVRVRLPHLRGLGRLASKLQAALRETSWHSLMTALLLSIPAWILEAGILWVASRSLGMEISFSIAVAATCFAVLAGSIPLSPGGLGTYEAGMVLVLSALGQPVELAFAAAVTTHLLKFMYAFAAAPFALGEGLSVVRNRKVELDETSVKV